ncbi:methyltransferase family protein [Thiomicrolovo sp. ZZH C-3]
MPLKPAHPTMTQPAGHRLWLNLVLLYLIIPLVLLLCGGDIGWWQGWLFSVLIFAAGIGGRYFAEKRHPGLLAERASMEKAQSAKKWDKILAPLMALSLSFPLVIVAGLDHRYGWTPPMPVWLNMLGLVIIALGYAFAAWAIVENRFFSTTVRIQTERGHTVCDSGPYRVVRHPGYAGNLLALIGIIIALDSLWSLIPSIAALIIAVIRTALEDKTLREELPGYADYAKRVRYRLFPGIY